MPSKSAKFYASHPVSRERKKAYDTKLESKPAQVKKRVEANRANRKAGTAGNHDYKDMAHTARGLVLKPQSKNRGDSNDQPGDRRARGKKK
jgi:hypothetical protein